MRQNLVFKAIPLFALGLLFFVFGRFSFASDGYPHAIGSATHVPSPVVPGSVGIEFGPVIESLVLMEDVPEEVQQFRLDDGSVVSVNYESGQVAIQLGVRGPKIDEEFTEGDFGGIFWDWGQLVPQEDGTWYYEDWLDEGYESAATPLSPEGDWF